MSKLPLSNITMAVTSQRTTVMTLHLMRFLSPIQLFRRAGDWIKLNPWLTTVVALGTVLRLSTLLWGLPIGHSTVYAGDEPKLQWPAEKVLEMYGSVPGNPQYGTSVQYTLGLAVWPLRLVFRLVPPLAVRDHLLMWILLRGLVILMAAMTIVLTYQLARMLFSKPAGLIAAVIVCLSPLHVHMSAIFMLDVPMAFLLVVNCVLLIHAVERVSVSNIIWLGIATAYLIGTKIPTVVFCLVATVLLWIGPAGRACQLSERAVRVVRYLTVVAVVLFITSPHYFLDSAKFLEKLLVHRDQTIIRVAPSLASVVANSAASLKAFFGWHLIILLAIGLIGMGRDRGRFKAAIVLYVLLIVGVNRGYLAERYIIGFLPLLAVLLGHGCWLLSRIPVRSAPIFAAGVASAIAVTSMVTCAGTIRAQYSETRTPAARFLAERYTTPVTIGFSFISKGPLNNHLRPRIVDELFLDTQHTSSLLL